MQEPYIFKDTIINNIIMNWSNVSDKYIYEICKIVCIDDFVNNKPKKLEFCLESGGKIFHVVRNKELHWQEH